jgi:hypothetical protein
MRTYLPELGISIRDDGEVWTIGGFLRGRKLGTVTGASAQVTDGTQVHRVGAAVAGAALLGPVGLLPALTRKAKAAAFVIFADGTMHDRRLNGNGHVRRAQAEAIRFNQAAAGVPSLVEQEADEDLRSW